jgi:uncharacterized membrane protein
MSYAMYPSKNVILGHRTGQCLKNARLKSWPAHFCPQIQVLGGATAVQNRAKKSVAAKTRPFIYHTWPHRHLRFYVNQTMWHFACRFLKNIYKSLAFFWPIFWPIVILAEGHWALSLFLFTIRCTI